MSGELDAAEGGGRLHCPVLSNECVDALALTEGLIVVDATVGVGGHAEAIARHLGERGILVCLDRDPSVLPLVQQRLCGVAPRVELRHSSYDSLESILRDLGLAAVDRVLMDLGVGSHQLDDPGRGLSFRSEGPLDMRYDPTTGPTAHELLRRTPEHELARWFWEYGEERHARRIARAIVRQRECGTLPGTTGELADLVVRAVPSGHRHGRRHIATRAFQALRIAVNRELETLDAGLAAAHRALRVGGRLAAISFHSLEDRRVKSFMRERMQPLFKKPARPGEAEVRANPRSRSARLRVAVKTADSDPRAVRQEATT